MSYCEFDSYPPHRYPVQLPCAVTLLRRNRSNKRSDPSEDTLAMRSKVKDYQVIKAAKPSKQTRSFGFYFAVKAGAPGCHAYSAVEASRH